MKKENKSRVLDYSADNAAEYFLLGIKEALEVLKEGCHFVLKIIKNQRNPEA